MSFHEASGDPAVPRLRVDTHVHFHSCYDEVAFIEAAFANLDPAASDSAEVFAAICLTETASAHWFDSLTSRYPPGELGGGRWGIEETEETNSLIVSELTGRKLAIIAGRQIASAEGLEVLAIGLTESIKDGGPIRDIMTSVDAAGGLPVVPWGFGKWSGRRGKLVRTLLDAPPCRFALGDNGGRPAAFREPALLQRGREMGFSILPGTDPFPFRWEGSKVGRFGIEWNTALGAGRPYHDLESLISNRRESAQYFGCLEAIPAFIRNQIAIQARSRRG